MEPPQPFHANNNHDMSRGC